MGEWRGVMPRWTRKGVEASGAMRSRTPAGDLMATCAFRRLAVLTLSHSRSGCLDNQVAWRSHSRREPGGWLDSRTRSSQAGRLADWQAGAPCIRRPSPQASEPVSCALSSKVWVLQPPGTSDCNNLSRRRFHHQVAGSRRRTGAQNQHADRVLRWRSPSSASLLSLCGGHGAPRKRTSEGVESAELALPVGCRNVQVGTTTRDTSSRLHDAKLTS